MPMQSDAVSVDERDDIDVAAQMFRGFGDPTRLAILTEGWVSSLEELQARVTARESSAGAGNEGTPPARALACPPEALEGLTVHGTAVLDGTPVAVVRSGDGVVTALTLRTCAPVR